MREAKALLNLAKELVAVGEVSLEDLSGSISFSPKFITGKTFYVHPGLGGIFVRGPYGAEYFRKIRWRDRHGELGLSGAPIDVQRAFDYYGGNLRKLIAELKRTKAFHIKKIA